MSRLILPNLTAIPAPHWFEFWSINCILFFIHFSLLLLQLISIEILRVWDAYLKMLAIFDGRVAKRPECMKMPHKNAVSALKDDFLVNHFTSLYPDSVVISSQASFTFAYSLAASSSPLSERSDLFLSFLQFSFIWCESLIFNFMMFVLVEIV